MSLFGLALLLTAAALHTTWNLLIKQAEHRRILTWWAMLAGSLCALPLVIFGPPVPAAAWPYLLASGGIQVIYTLALTRAYERGDFSLVYPIARGAAPALLALWSTMFLGERPSSAGLVGLALLLSGLLVIGGGTWWAQRRQVEVGSGSIAAALGVACAISGYSAIDAAAVRFAPPGPYTVLEIGVSGLLLAPLLLAQHGGRLLVERLRLDWRRVLVVGALTVGAYMLVLQAYTLAPVAYGGAIREISVVFAALIGWRWLGEGFGRSRLLGALLIFCGILVIAIAG